MIPSRSVGGLALLVVAMALAGCGATRSSPDNPLSAGGLTPSLEDKEAGLVAVAPSGKVVLATADRRVASIGLFGGDDEDHLRESFDDMARDLAKFLVRLSKGEAPRKD